MSVITAFAIATFTMPERIGVDAPGILWLLPLAASITVVYKATKLQKIKAANFIKESTILFGSIVVFMAITALVLLALSWLVT